MMHFPTRYRAALLLAAAGLMSVPAASADAVWHCSRAPDVVSETDTAQDLDDSFQLASGVANPQAVYLSLMDLIDVYSGKTILINGRRLTACFMQGDTPLSSHALHALGLKPATMQLQARKSAIVQSHLQLATDETEMLSCISRHYPAVGYLGKPKATEQVVPCF
jgi:hypothetical protein